MVGDSMPVLVQAIYTFKGKNNDELCFKKGDIITITQREEGGWWEGTLGEKTGWFPSNYVKDHKLQDSTNLGGGSTSPTNKLPVDLVAQQKGYRNVVLKDIIDSEKANVSELQGLLKNFLHPLEKSDILTRDEYRQLVGNIGHVVETHQQLLSALEDCSQRAPPDQRVGKVFLAAAPRVKMAHQAYCAAHPRAVCILDKYKEELNGFMEGAGAASPGLLVLTTGLSKPFRRLEKYAGMLQELERHLGEDHPDRGDTQRSVSVYKDVASACSGTRRQKELELEVLTGGVRGWEGENLALLGDILHMGSVAVGADHRDRYLVLFPTTLLVLSVSQRMSAFVYEGKLPLTGINVARLDDSETYKNAFEITGPMIERILAVCQTRDDQQTWVDMLKQHIRTVRSTPVPSPTAPLPSPPPPPHVSLPPHSPYATLAAYFAGLIERGLITAAVVKRLLYSQFGKYEGVVSFEGVKVRHRHRVECVIYPARASGTLTWIESGSDGSSSGKRSAVLERQDAVDCEDEDDSSCSSCASNPFGFIRYYPGQSETASFDGFLREPELEHDNDVSVSCSGRPESETKGDYVSTASLSLHNNTDTNRTAQSRPYLTIISNLPSDESSFERSSAHKEFSYSASACEDLAHLDELPSTSFPSKQHLDAPARHETRQSLPTTFRAKPPIPPKPLALCAPTYQSASHRDLVASCHAVGLRPKPQLSHSLPALPGDEAHSPPTTHSSTLDVPGNLIQVPSQMLAELLYSQGASILGLMHQQESASSDHSTATIRTVLDAPSNDNTTNLSRKHSHWSREAWKDSDGSVNRGATTDESLRYDRFGKHGQFGSEPDCAAAKRCQQAAAGYCRCCGHATLPLSCRSSDSGLADIAGNSTLPSPDLSSPLPEASSPDVSDYCPYNLPPGIAQRSARSDPPLFPARNDPLFEARNDPTFETQCISPFGSTPRISARPSLTSENIFVGSTESVRSVPSLPTSPPWEEVDRRPPQAGTRPLTYRSGMYAHWWLKAKIPASAVLDGGSTSSESPAPSATDVAGELPAVPEGEPAAGERDAAS